MWSVLNPRELLTCFDSGTYTLCVTSSRILVLRRHVPKAFPVIIPLRPHSCVLCVPPYLFHSTAHSFFNQNFDWSHARCHQSYQLVNQIYLLPPLRVCLSRGPLYWPEDIFRLLFLRTICLWFPKRSKIQHRSPRLDKIEIPADQTVNFMVQAFRLDLSNEFLSKDEAIFKTIRCVVNFSDSL